jgi:hypothetical protein
MNVLWILICLFDFRIMCLYIVIIYIIKKNVKRHPAPRDATIPVLGLAASLRDRQV